MILGLLPWFRKCNGTSAILSIIGGIIAFIILKITNNSPLAINISGPMICSLIIYITSAFLSKKMVPAKVNDLLASLMYDEEKKPDEISDRQNEL
jgi:SSS family solute:Na+ symporter